MKTTFKLIAILAVFSLFYFGNRVIQTNMGEKAVDALSFTVYSMEQGVAKAQSENKLILADYSAIWCPTCRRLDEEVFAKELVATSINDNFVYVRLEYDSPEGKAFAKKHDIQGFPRIIVLDINEEKLVEMPLVFNPEEYANNLGDVLSAYHSE